ncbi:E3 ubiquitin ligase BIG BROTHER-related-like [Magnolia sinica]|uniref:E3 ubiquitin ligase BIG BROTHER-related-like n=1 Tax=Magnolia sinica TaxID=86752 RepID=UPI00265AD901|nr:E3 ubiquitin ligase BIG BROTHER-related-like [Magnolia sinica]
MIDDKFLPFDYVSYASELQERAYMMLKMNGGDGSGYGSSDSGGYVYEDEAGDDPNDDGNDAGSIDDGEDAFNVHRRAPSEDELGAEIDPSAFDSDEAYARALQDAEEREVVFRLMALAGINDCEFTRTMVF